jgi:hypothetical protein
MKRPLFGTRLIAGINDEPEANFRLSSNSEVQARNGEVRFSLKNRHRQAGLSGPKSANKRHKAQA